MKSRHKFNFEKINKKIFSSTNIDEFISYPENENEVTEKCRKYYEMEYPIVLKEVTDQNGTYWIAEHPDLPGCKTHGATKEEALLNLEDAKKGWVYAKICDNETIPEPNSCKDIEECSGRILVRLPKELHYKLLKKAKADETSLNQEILFLISHALGEIENNQQILRELNDIKDLLLEEKLKRNRENDLWNSINKGTRPRTGVTDKVY